MNHARERGCLESNELKRFHEFIQTEVGWMRWMRWMADWRAWRSSISIEHSRHSDHLQAMALVLRNDDAACLIDCQIAGKLELAISISLLAKLREEGSIMREYLNAIVISISNDDAALLIDSNS